MVSGTLEALRFAGVAVSPVALRVRQAYQGALSFGRGVTEWEPNGAAAAETRALAALVQGKLWGEGQTPRPANDVARPGALSTVQT